MGSAPKMGDRVKERISESVADQAVLHIWKIIPPIAMIVTWCLGNLAHLVFSPAWLWSVLFVVSTTAIVAEQVMVGKGTRGKRALYALTFGFIGYWLSGAILWGTMGTMGQIMLWGGMCLSVAMAIFPNQEVEDDDSRTDRFTRRFDKVKEAWGHGKTKLKKLPTPKRKDGTENPFKSEYDIEVDDVTQNSDSALDLKGKIAAREHISPDKVVVSPNPDDYHKARVTIVTGNIENDDLPWEGPSIPSGGTMMDPVRLGLRIDGEPGHMLVPDRHIQVMGMTGSGKSFGFAWNFFAEVITRYSRAGRTELWGMDLVKGRQTFGPLMQAFDKVAVTEQEVHDMILQLKDEVRDRMNTLTDEGLGTWKPQSSLRFRIVYIEEAPKVFEYMEEDMGMFGKIAGFWKEARSAGIVLVTSLQIATNTEQPKSVLRQISNRICFGINDMGDADYGLNSVAIKNGADPSRWGSFKPGMCYMSVEGIPQHEWHTPVRTYLMTREQMVKHCSQYPAPGKEDWVITKDANGMLISVPPNQVQDTDEDGNVLAGITYINPEEDIVDEEYEGLSREQIEEINQIEEDWERRVSDTDDNEEIIEILGEEMDRPMAKSSVSFGTIPEEDTLSTRERAMKLLEEWKAQDMRVFKPSALIEHLGAKRSTVSNMLKRMVNDGVLIEVGYGKYGFGPNFGKIVE